MTDNNYYLFNNEQEEGPYTLEEMLDMNLDVDTMVLSPVAGDWQRASDLPEFFHYFEAKGVYFPTEDNLASFWWRLLAYVIDAIIVSVLLSFFASTFIIAMYKEMEGNAVTNEALLARLKFNLIVFVVSAVYHSIFEATPMRGSIGKRICKLAVVDADGRRLSILKALVRNFSKLLSSIVFGIGYLTILWDDHRQAWHDKIAKTYIIIRNQ
jgi:uncharacterized RDD family membrane protein YckC